MLKFTAVMLIACYIRSSKVKEVNKGIETIPVVDAYVFQEDSEEPLQLNSFILQKKIARIESYLREKASIPSQKPRTFEQNILTDNGKFIYPGSGLETRTDENTPDELRNLPNVWNINELRIC